MLETKQESEFDTRRIRGTSSVTLALVLSAILGSRHSFVGHMVNNLHQCVYSGGTDCMATALEKRSKFGQID